MIQETNFNDIRRNFMLASVILILFLLYGNEIKIEQILIFKFDKKGDWALLSPYLDILIFLLIFWLYTFARYGVYAFFEIEKNSLSLRLFIDILYKTQNLGNDVIESISIKKNENIKSYEKFSISANGNGIENKNVFTISLTNISENKIYYIPNTVKNLKIQDDRISFSGVDIVFKSKDIRKDFGPGLFKLIFRKEYSDYWWPLFLILPIMILIIFRLIDFFILK